MKTAFKCRAYPTEEQTALLNRTFGCIRFVWNYTLDERHKLWHQARKSLSYKQSDANLTALKRNPEYAWLNEVSAVPLQQAIRHQYAAMQAFFQKRARYPRFKIVTLASRQPSRGLVCPCGTASYGFQVQRTAEVRVVVVRCRCDPT